MKLPLEVLNLYPAHDYTLTGAYASRRTSCGRKPFLLFAGFGAVIFFLATAWLLARVYFDLAALRFWPPHQVKVLREMHIGTIYVAGLLIAAFVSIPIVNLATPLFAMALMVRVHKRIVARQAADRMLVRAR